MNSVITELTGICESWLIIKAFKRFKDYRVYIIPHCTLIIALQQQHEEIIKGEQ